MELNDLILLAAASLFRESDDDSSSGGPDPYEVAVKKAKRLWNEVLKQD